MDWTPAAPPEVAVGVISDTHGLLRPQAVQALAGSDLILHAGDVGDPGILVELGRIAPVTSVRGNVDKGAWALALPETELVEAAEHLLHIVHDLSRLDLDPVAAGFAAVISGHSHQPMIERREGVLFLNPGSAGPRRFGLPVTVARLRCGAAGLRAEIVHLRI